LNVKKLTKDKKRLFYSFDHRPTYVS